MPLILLRYIGRETLKPYALNVLGLTGIILLITVFDQLRIILKYQPPFLTSIKFFLFQVPEFLVMAMPFASLMAVLFCLARLSRDGEIVAMKALGLGLGWALLPMVLIGASISIAAFGINELLVPYSKNAAETIKKVEIEKSEDYVQKYRHNLAILASGGRMFHITLFDGTKNTMKGIILFEMTRGIHLNRRIDARRAEYKDGHWTFFEAMVRDFDDEGLEAHVELFLELPMLDVTESPEYFLRVEKNPRQLSLFRLIKYIQMLRESGAEVTEELVELHLKMSFPFANLIMILLGTSFGWAMGHRGSFALAFGLGLAVGLVFLGFVQFGHALGTNGKLPPFWSAWVGNIVFFVFAVFLLKRTPT